MNEKKSINFKIVLVALVILLLGIFYAVNILTDLGHMRVDTSNNTGKTIIRKASYDIMANNTYMVISKNGKVVIMDPYDMIPCNTPNLITVSHLHGDHFDEEFVNNMSCNKSIAKVENKNLSGIKMISLASSHGPEPINYSNPSNVIYLFEIDSLKIAHMGDFGQNELTDEQKSALKGVDILITPCAFNPVTEQSLSNILDALHPPVIFTTHLDNKRLNALKKHIAYNTVLMEKYIVSKADINSNTMKLISLERNNHSLLFVRYLLLKFTGSPLFRIFIALFIVIISILIIIFRKRNKNIKLTKV